jgi:hypothetical protein
MAELRIDRVLERVMVTGTGCALIAAVAALDETVRNRIAGVFQGQGLSELTFLSGQLQRLMRTAGETVGYTGTEEPTMVYFAIAAVVLLVAMLRT